MNALVLAAVVTNVLCAGYRDAFNYTADMLIENDLPLSMTNQLHGWSWRTTTNAPSFHIQAGDGDGWIRLEWTDDLTTGVWSPLCFDRPVRPCSAYDVYMHPESEITKRMIASNAGFFRQAGTDRTIKVDMSGFWPKQVSTNAVSTVRTSPPTPGE